MARAGYGAEAADAAGFAESAGRVLLELRTAGGEGKEVGARGDAGAHEHLMELIRGRYPEDAVLSEEGADDVEARLAAERVWIVDPLDGTREYGELDRDDWAVHVALWASGELVAGAVALPARGLVLHTGEGGVPPLPARDAGPLRIAVSRTRPPALVEPLVAALGAVTVPMGSAGVKALSVLLGASDAYVHAGGQFEWDSAAPVVVAAAAGLHVSRIDGSPLVYNRRDPKLPDLVVCRPEVAEQVLGELAQLV